MSMLIPIRDLNPTRRFPVVTLVLIGANVLAFFAASSGLGISEGAAYRWGAVPCDVFNHCPTLTQQLEVAFPNRSSLMSIFTSMFMHADILHLGFNMLFLWVFGNNVEDRLGRIRFPIFYVATGLAAAFAHMLVSAESVVPVIGASGAVSGVLGAYAVLWPGATVIALVPIFFFFFTTRLPAWIMLGIWFLVQLLGSAAGFGRATGEQGGVAYLAHVGGFIAGVVLIFVFGGYQRSPRGPLDPRGDPFGDRRSPFE
ncbi:MAG: rhomboid family intramembrane serine protease [Actinomycetota bacterium]